MSLALSTCVLFISLIQSVNEARFSNTTFLLLFFPPVPLAAVFATDIVPRTNIYASLESHKLYFRIAVLNLI